MQDLNCKNKPKENVFGNKPYIITAQQYAQIQDASAAKENRIKQELENQAYYDWQKNVGEALEAQYTGKKQQTLEEKLNKQKVAFLKKSEESSKQLQLFKENDEKVRRAKIMKAEKILEKSKPGTRLLHTAAIHSEVLRERNLQKIIKDEFQRVVEEDQEKLAKSCVSLHNPWIWDLEKRKEEKLTTINNYKREVLKDVEERAQKKLEIKHKQLAQEKMERERIDNDIKRQIEKEKDLLEKKRKKLRQSAVEAMKMVEERRQRERLIEEVEDRLNCVYNQSKQELNKKLKETMEQKNQVRAQMIEETAKQLPNDVPKQEKDEAEQLCSHLNLMELKFTEAEKERKRKEKAAKQARIEAHLQEVERQKKLRQYLCQRQIFDMAQRFKNDEVNYKFALLKGEERRRQLEQFRSILKEQMDEKQRKQAEEVDCLLDDPYIQDDQKFFELAQKYIADAKRKDRPLYPFIKAIEQYKRDNQIDCVRTLPKHLLSKIAIGCRQAADTAVNKGANNQSSLHEQNLQECLKTKEMLTNGLREERSRKPSVCLPKDVDLNMECSTTLECDKCNLSRRESAGANGKLKEDLLSEEGSDKIRYSMSHLKYINENKNSYNYDSCICY